MQCIPRQVWLDISGKMLMQWPIEEVEKLRDKQISIKGEKLAGGSILEVSGITASQVCKLVLFFLFSNPFLLNCRSKYSIHDDF